MIIDSIQNLERYRGLSAHMDLAITYIRTADLGASPFDRTDVDGDKVYVNHLQYKTAPKSENSLFEAHRKYLDLHIILSGQENVAVTPVEALTPVEERLSEDAMMYQGDSAYQIPLAAGSFILLYPGEGHLPRLTIDGSISDVDKLVFKIQI